MMSELAPPVLQQQALEWMVTLWSGEIGDDEHADFAAWRQTSPAHEAAWQSVQRMSARLRELPAEPAAKVLAKQPDTMRRNALRGLAVMLLGGTALHVVRESSPWKTFAASHVTATGERRELTLEDGTLVTMNTTSALDVDYDENSRRIVLHAGEIMISTAAEGYARYRPFTVHTPQGTARALGTRFSVRLDSGVAQVAVYDGAVELRPQTSTSVMRLDAGQGARFDKAKVEALQPARTADTAWVEGRLEVEQMRLADFVAELSRYRRGWLRCDPAIADLRVSGAFPLADTRHVLESLEQALPVHVSYVGPYWASVQAR